VQAAQFRGIDEACDAFEAAWLFRPEPPEPRPFFRPRPRPAPATATRFGGRRGAVRPRRGGADNAPRHAGRPTRDTDRNNCGPVVQ
jgi:hypothetical protein